jgi:hypothetical protein
MMRILELFSGTASFSKVARARGHECITVDNGPKFNPDICADVDDFDPFSIPMSFDIVWASPPCEAFSTNTIGRNWNRDYTPKSKKAVKALELVERTLDIIRILAPRFYVIENPRAMLRKMPIMQGWPRKMVTYCQYGDTRMKPTDLWTNVPFEPKSCNYGDPCHPRTPRGCYSGKSYTELAIVPPKLCEEIIIACEKAIV